MPPLPARMMDGNGITPGEAMRRLVEANPQPGIDALHSFSDVVDTTGEPWPRDARRVWLRFGLTMVGCAAGGFAVATLIVFGVGKIVRDSAHRAGLHLTAGG